jgi:hypothetical protein
MNKNPTPPAPQLNLNMPVRPLHVKIVQLYLEGQSYKKICKELNTSRQTIAVTIKKYGITELLEAQLEQCQNEIAALATKAIDAVRRSLDSDDGFERLKASDIIFKLNRMYDLPRQTETTFSQMIQKILTVVPTRIDVRNPGNFPGVNSK